MQCRHTSETTAVAATAGVRVEVRPRSVMTGESGRRAVVPGTHLVATGGPRVRRVCRAQKPASAFPGRGAHRFRDSSSCPPKAAAVASSAVTAPAASAARLRMATPRFAARLAPRGNGLGRGDAPLCGPRRGSTCSRQPARSTAYVHDGSASALVGDLKENTYGIPPPPHGPRLRDQVVTPPDARRP